MGVSTDSPAVLADFSRKNRVKHLLLADPDRTMLAAYGALVTQRESPMYGFAKRAYFIIDRRGTVTWMHIQANALDLLDPEEVLQALRQRY